MPPSFHTCNLDLGLQYSVRTSKAKPYISPHVSLMPTKANCPCRHFPFRRASLFRGAVIPASLLCRNPSWRQYRPQRFHFVPNANAEARLASSLDPLHRCAAGPTPTLRLLVLWTHPRLTMVVGRARRAKRLRDKISQPSDMIDGQTIVPSHSAEKQHGV